VSTPETDPTPAATETPAIPKTLVDVEVDDLIKRYGYVHRIVYAHGANSANEAAAWAKAYVKKLAQPDRTFTFNHEGIPTLHRGDTLKLILGSCGLTQTVWIVETTHNLSADDYTMDVTTKFEWPDEPDDQPHITEDDEANVVAADTGRVPPTKPKKPPKPKPKGSSEHDDIPLGATPTDTVGHHGLSR